MSITAGAGCPWTATSAVQWITFSGATTGSGNGTVTFNVAANTGPARTGTLTIAGTVFAVTQANGCTYSINPNSREVEEDGGTLTVTVSTGAGCPWTATTSFSWITVTNGTNRIGPGTVTIVVAALPSGNNQNGNGNGGNNDDRTGTVLIAGRIFTVEQKDDD